jgi:anthranilate/para-aminobenzoate synthase component I
LAERRQDLISQIYEITGVSDIMRGNSDPSETATAVTKKTNFGTLRNQDRQNDMQRFITDLFKIKAEIICERFSEETLAQFAEENTDGNLVMQAIQLLKTDKLRGMTLGIETDTSFEQDGDGQKVNDAITLIHTMITNAFQAVSAQPLLLPLYRKMVETVVISFPNARQYEPVIEQVFDGIQQELAAAKQQQQPNPEIMKVQLQQQKNQQDFQNKQEQNRIKEEELALKQHIEEGKLALANQEMNYQFALRDKELDIKGETNENIPTGFVGGF